MSVQITYRKRRSIVSSQTVQDTPATAPASDPAPMPAPIARSTLLPPRREAGSTGNRCDGKKPLAKTGKPFSEKRNFQKPQKRKKPLSYSQRYPQNALERHTRHACFVQPVIPMFTKRERAAEIARKTAVKAEILSFPIFQSEITLPIARNIHQKLYLEIKHRRVANIRRALPEWGMTKLAKAQLEIDIQKFLHKLVLSKHYLIALTQHEQRFNLNCEPDGWVYTKEKDGAERLLAKRHCITKDGESVGGENANS